ncbi:hypothetical protein AB0J47_42085 [Nocardia sp. NPDC049737]|uniref:hypothetical protein n=1 Tax=Nocardia sp. NPDC049737 TaxID=3154358 RepID=UPI00343C5F34
MSDIELIHDAYNRRIVALHDTIRAWATTHGVTVAPAYDGDFSIDLTRNGRQVTVRLLPSWEQRGPVGDASVIVEDEDSALRMMCISGDSGMPTAAALKGLLTGLLIPEVL